MVRTIVMTGLGFSALMLGACTTRSDVREARRDVRDAYRYGDRQDVRDARRDYRRTKRDYRRDNRCGPAYGRPC